MTHRFSWELAYGAVPAGMQVLHRCDVRNCVNPAHLFLGTNADNRADSVAKNRHAKGEKFSPLTVAQVREIRGHLKAGVKLAVLSRQYGVSQTAVSNIKTSKTWRWLT